MTPRRRANAPDIQPDAVRYRCQCGGPCGDHTPGLHFVGLTSFLPEPDGRTHTLRCARCNRWNLYRADGVKAA